MRQVPAFEPITARYLLIGGGRVARHFRHYLELEALSFTTWSRSETEAALKQKFESASHVLVLISDSAIETFLRERPWLLTKTCVHMSGALVTALAPSAHPLMTFGHELYTLEDYRRIPFVFERDRGSRAELLPGLNNPESAIDPEKKSLYHALCVLSGNFTVMLWEKAFSEFQSELGLSRTTLLPYLERIARNLATAADGESVLTGPVARGDSATIEKNLNALHADPFESVYRAFLNAFPSTRQNSQEKR